MWKLPEHKLQNRINGSVGSVYGSQIFKKGDPRVLPPVVSRQLLKI